MIFRTSADRGRRGAEWRPEGRSGRQRYAGPEGREVCRVAIESVAVAMPDPRHRLRSGLRAVCVLPQGPLRPTRRQYGRWSILGEPQGAIIEYGVRIAAECVLEIMPAVEYWPFVDRFENHGRERAGLLEGHRRTGGIVLEIERDQIVWTRLRDREKMPCLQSAIRAVAEVIGAKQQVRIANAGPVALEVGIDPRETLRGFMDHPEDAGSLRSAKIQTCSIVVRDVDDSVDHGLVSCSLHVIAPGASRNSRTPGQTSPGPPFGTIQHHPRLWSRHRDSSRLDAPAPAPAGRAGFGRRSRAQQPPDARRD